MDLNLAPCAGCGKPKVLKPGDYCLSCALDPDLYNEKHEYYVLSPAVLELVADKSGITREFLSAKMERSFERYQHYVVYRAGERWQDVVISDLLHIPTVMKHLYKRLEG